MSLALNHECLQCHLRRNLEVASGLGTQEQTMAFARDLMRMYLDAPGDVASPWFNPIVSDLLEKHYGLPQDRYKEEKLLSNQYVLSRFCTLKDRICTLKDPLYAALQLSILGNYLDFSALQGNVSFAKLDEMVDSFEDLVVDTDTYQALREELKTAKTLLYLTDNAGEIGFDRLFAEEIAKVCPDLQITFCVRGAITINDATRADAEAVGIPFPVIDNGNRVPGTQIDLLSPEARQALTTSDIILAKGMANCETLYGCGLNIYYAFLVKCQRFASIFQKPLLTPMLVKERL